jgi:transketolase
MRTTFAKTLLKIAQKDSRVMLLTGDLGYSVFEDFQKNIPKQYLNMGVAEQNMAGVAAGLAMEGYMPFIYSIVPFTTMRNFEQIRNDICYQNLNVKIVGVGAGFSYGPYGHTHHGLEDIGILRTIPNLIILTPGDPVEVALATKAMVSYKGPVYLRLGKAGEPIIHKKTPKFTIGKGIILQEGSKATIIATSTLLERAMAVAAAIGSVRVISMPTIKPLDEKIIIDSMKKTKVLVTLEEHSVIGGLGSAVSEVVAESGLPVRFKRIAVADRFTKVIGLQEYMRKANGLGVEQIVKTIKQLL